MRSARVNGKRLLKAFANSVAHRLFSFFEAGHVLKLKELLLWRGLNLFPAKPRCLSSIRLFRFELLVRPNGVVFEGHIDADHPSDADSHHR